jgi:hypothetical protein
MILRWSNQEWATVHVLLDTGCSVPLISNTLADEKDIPTIDHASSIDIRNFSGEIVKGAGERYTLPLTLQYRKHYTQEVFEVAPLEPGVDIFLPFWWVAKHVPQGAWDSEELRFTSRYCLAECTKAAASAFPLDFDEGVLTDPAARLIGYVSAVEDNSSSLRNVPPEFQQFIGIMEKKAADALPAHAPYDMKIELKEGENAPWCPIYPLSELELETLREWLKEMMKTGKIRRSTSPAGSPILFVPKPNGRGLRLCVDYRGINRVTIPNRYPLPLMQELQDRTQGAQFFTKMDLKNGFHLIRIREGDEWKTAFRTRYGLYEFMVMPFGLTNAPATFQDMMNHIFRDMIDLGLLVYMDDLLA